MIIKDHNFQQFLKNIPTEKKIFLLHGSLISKIWYYRKLLEFKLVGPKALQQMKLVLIDRSILQKDKDIVLNEIKTRSFFGDKKAVVVNDINDKDVSIIREILDNFDIEDHYLILTSGYLNQNSKIRKLVEEDINSCATGFYPSELSERDIESQLKSFEISVNDKEVIKKLRDLSSVYDFLEFKQELKKLFFFKSFDKKPLSQEEVESVFSQEVSKNERKLFDFLLEKKEDLIVDFFSNYPGEIKNPNSFFVSANNHLRVLFRMINTDDKSFAFLKKVWPPVLGKNKEKFLNIMKYWTKSSIEDALLILKEAELRTRKNSKLSHKKIISFAFLEICLLNK